MTPIKTILYPTDFSEPSQVGLGLACALARDQGAHLIVLHIMPSSVPATRGANIWDCGTAGHDEYHRNGFREEMREKLERLPLPGLTMPVERLLKEGDVARMILETARETCCDLLVMGSHGLTGSSWRLMGSVAEEVANKAICPILYVKVPLVEPESTAQASREEVDVIL